MVKCTGKKGDQREPIPKGNCWKAKTSKDILVAEYLTNL